MNDERTATNRSARFEPAPQYAAATTTRSTGARTPEDLAAIWRRGLRRTAVTVAPAVGIEARAGPGIGTTAGAASCGKYLGRWAFNRRVHAFAVRTGAKHNGRMTEHGTAMGLTVMTRRFLRQPTLALLVLAATTVAHAQEIRSLCLAGPPGPSSAYALLSWNGPRHVDICYEGYFVQQPCSDTGDPEFSQRGVPPDEFRETERWSPSVVEAAANGREWVYPHAVAYNAAQHVAWVQPRATPQERIELPYLARPGFSAELPDRCPEPVETTFVPFFPRHSPERQGFVRVLNQTGAPLSTTVTASDDAAGSQASVILDLEPNEAFHFNAHDLEHGNDDKGLAAIGAPHAGDWTLSFDRGPDAIRVAAYVRTADGFVSRVDRPAPVREGRFAIDFFNPASNRSQVSVLRLANPGERPASVTITGIDDRGGTGRGPVRLEVGANEACTVSARMLESGTDVRCGEAQGALGDGQGKWRLQVSAPLHVRVLSLLRSPTGQITNP